MILAITMVTGITTITVTNMTMAGITTAAAPSLMAAGRALTEVVDSTVGEAVVAVAEVTAVSGLRFLIAA
jgi:hypothetical protein